MPDRPTSTGEDPRYFAVQADIGITKHMGGRKATDELAALCRLGLGQRVLEIGCGIGSTTCYLAERYGCRMTSIDLSARMAARTRERAARRGLSAQVDVQVADAQHLPFAADSFDAVIDESVTAFVPDKRQALHEYARVAKPGGYVGLNEATWVQPPPPEVVEYTQFIMAGADFQAAAGWRALLEGAGLRDVDVRTYAFDPRSQYVEEIKQLDLAEYAAAWRRFFSRSLSDPAFRQFARDILRTPGNILKFMQSIGHGLYVGRKAQDDG